MFAILKILVVSFAFKRMYSYIFTNSCTNAASNRMYVLLLFNAPLTVARL
jgi:hypothetical protein